MVEHGSGASGATAVWARWRCEGCDYRIVDLPALAGAARLARMPYAVRVHAGIVGIPDVTVRAGSEHIMKMSMLELGRFGLPNPRGEVARELSAAEKAGDIKYYGALANVPLMLRLTRVMSVNP